MMAVNKGHLSKTSPGLSYGKSGPSSRSLPETSRLQTNHICPSHADLMIYDLSIDSASYPGHSNLNIGHHHLVLPQRRTAHHCCVDGVPLACVAKLTPLLVPCGCYYGSWDSTLGQCVCHQITSCLILAGFHNGGELL
jgi:hypothetical protein